jgi:hypothetical protein
MTFAAPPEIMSKIMFALSTNLLLTFGYRANTIPMVQRHCLSDDCVSADEHRELLELHRSRTRVLFRPATEERKALDKARALVEDPDVLQATAEHILGPSPKDFIQRVQQVRVTLARASGLADTCLY